MLSPDYVAGLFDGEGYVSLIYSKIRPWKRDPNRHVLGFKCVTGISSTNHEILMMLQSQFGGDVNFSVRKNDRHKPIGAWKITGKDGQINFLQTVRAAAVIKRKQIELGLTYLATSVQPGRRVGASQWNERLRIFGEMRELNRRGRGPRKQPSNNIPSAPSLAWNPKHRSYSDAELAEMMQMVRDTRRPMRTSHRT